MTESVLRRASKQYGREILMHPIAILLVFVFASASARGESQQKIIFEAQSIEYKQKDSYLTGTIREECATLSEEVSTYLESGWRVVASSPKEKVVGYNSGACVGTEYVLEKTVLEEPVPEKPQADRQSLLIVGVSSLIAGVLLVLGFQRLRRPVALSVSEGASTGDAGQGGIRVRSWKINAQGYMRTHVREVVLVIWTALVAAACLGWGSRVIGLRKQLSVFWYPDRDGYVEFVKNIIVAERIFGVLIAILCVSAVVLFLMIRKRRKDSEYV